MYKIGSKDSCLLQICDSATCNTERIKPTHQNNFGFNRAYHARDPPKSALARRLGEFQDHGFG
jgi:hypothetical protein